jgi:hypothetical protein
MTCWFGYCRAFVLKNSPTSRGVHTSVWSGKEKPGGITPMIVCFSPPEELRLRPSTCGSPPSVVRHKW